MPRTWRFAPHDEAVVRSLAAELKIPPLVAQVLAARGYYECESARTFLDTRLTHLHEPDLLPGIPQAAELVVSAMQSGRRITIYGDYDVDGITSVSLLWSCFKLAGAKVDYYIPDRIDEGYGLNCEALRRLHEEDPDRLVITVDCGISGVEEAALAAELGLQLIITDHHQFADTMPPAACLVHPRLEGSNYPFEHLCGVGVAFKLAWAVCQRLGESRKAPPHLRDFLIRAVGLAAIGTVADVVPLTGENRVIVRHGLHSLGAYASIGLKALLQIAEIDSSRPVDAEDVAFGLAPRLNAVGRLGQARLAVELLTTHDAARAEMLATHINHQNEIRRTVERKIFKQAKEMVATTAEWQSQQALVLAHPEWHVGVIGIVASRIAEHFEKPTILIALDRAGPLGHGSGRSFNGFNLHAGLKACAAHLSSFGGHDVAVGLKIDQLQIDVFRDEFCRFVADSLDGTKYEYEWPIDAEVGLSDLTPRAVKDLDRLGPFGESNSRPLFSASKVQLAEPPKKMGEGDRHLSLRIRQYKTVLRAVAFGRGNWADEIAAVDGPISVCFAPAINRYRGMERVELQLKDWKPAGSGAENAPSKSVGAFL